jgi:hypothetical protein
VKSKCFFSWARLKQIPSNPPSAIPTWSGFFVHGGDQKSSVPEIHTDRVGKITLNILYRGLCRYKPHGLRHAL